MSALIAIAVVGAGCWTDPKPPTGPRVAAPPPPPADTAAPPRPVAPRWTSGVAECDAVVALYEKLFQCDRFTSLPPEALAAQRDGLEAMKKAWRFDTDADRQAGALGCAAALDALRQSATAMGCAV